MTFIADSSFLYALFRPRDAWHRDAKRFASSNSETILVPNVVLPEVCYLITRDLGHRGIEEFIEYFAQLNALFAPLILDDLGRIHEIVSTYADAELDIVDCCIMAIAERLKLTRIATFDRRDFAMVRPRHCDFLELLP
ncbi:MAG: PIN domain-containing protein [Anaerolineae bacterium]|nr:PIN domain-containing protein [Anaerolineae bacterium]